jgi:hypothetical protein
MVADHHAPGMQQRSHALVQGDPARERVELAVRREIPVTFSEPPVPRDVVDGETQATIAAVRRAAFPFFGLAP